MHTRGNVIVGTRARATHKTINTGKMKVIIAIDSLKGSLTSAQACRAAEEGALQRWPAAEIVCLPVSDGGEGWLEAFEKGQPGRWHRQDVTVHDPLQREIHARYLQAQETAIIEIAEVCGLALLKADERDPLHATTYGLGELIAEAYLHGCRNFTIGLGGSATSDAGRGLTEALSPTLASLQAHCHFTIATDVTNPLLGPRGAAAVFAPQKGATPAMVQLLEERARAFAEDNARKMGTDSAMLPGAGAAGGLGYAFMQFLNAERRSGAELLLEALHFDSLIEGADLIITGEGQADQQTLMGKLPSIVLQYAKRAGVPCHLLAGRIDPATDFLSAGFCSTHCINPPTLPLSAAMQPEVARANLTATVSRL